MAKVSLAIFIVAGLTIVAQANPSLFKMPNVDELETFKHEFMDQVQKAQNQHSSNNNAQGHQPHHDRSSSFNTNRGNSNDRDNLNNNDRGNSFNTNRGNSNDHGNLNNNDRGNSFNTNRGNSNDRDNLNNKDRGNSFNTNRGNSNDRDNLNNNDRGNSFNTNRGNSNDRGNLNNNNDGGNVFNRNGRVNSFDSNSNNRRNDQFDGEREQTGRGIITRNHISKESSEDYSGEEQPASVGNLKLDANKFADQTIQKLKAKIVENDMSQITLPSDTYDFSRKFYGITYHGNATLNGGYVKGFDNIHRIGEATMHGHSNGTSLVTFESEFSDLEIGYNLDISFMLQHIPSQQVKGRLTSVTAKIEVLVDPNGKVILTDFDVLDSGLFKIETTGLGSFNFLLDRLVDTIGNLSKGVILESMEGKIRLLLNAVLNDAIYPVHALFATVQNELFEKFSNSVSKMTG